jgi:hypothetical protein
VSTGNGHPSGNGFAGPFFRCVASNGFGDPANSYAFAMEWFRDRLYVGTLRNTLALIAAAPPPEPIPIDPWPVPVPPDHFALDNRAQIWAYDPARDSWELALVSPVVKGVGGKPVPRDIGYRGMVVFRGPHDTAPALYVTPGSSSSRGLGTFLLRYDGTDGFEPAAEPLFGDRETSSVRGLVEFRGKLYMSPTGKGRAWNEAGTPCVYESDDPLSGRWRPVSPPFFGDAGNSCVYVLAVFRDQLYAGTLNPVSGYQVWKTEARGTPPYHWVKVLDHGAGRGNLNEGTCSMSVFNDALYIGSAISNGGYDRTHKIGPAPSELVRLYPDDSWDLLVGESRMTADGYKEARSGLGPGFDNRFARYFWTMAVHRGWLYLGTFDSLVFARWHDDRDRAPGLTQAQLDAAVEEHGGCELWRTRDGINWSPVTLDGFGNPFNYGIRTMFSTPKGLFVGTANPFGPYVATRLGDRWRYEPNPHGGTEIWVTP